MYGNVRQCMAMYNNIQQCTTMYGNVRQCMAMYDNIQQCTTIYGNVRQCTAMYGNMRQSGTIWYYHDLYYNRTEKRKREKCVYGCLNCMVVGYQFFVFPKVLLVSLEYCIRVYGCYTLLLTLVLFGLRGIRNEYYSLCHVNLRELIIY